jgi:hypothetical protein
VACRVPERGAVTEDASARRRPCPPSLERIEALPVSLTADEVLKAVSAHALGLSWLDRERLASLRLLGETHRP